MANSDWKSYLTQLQDFLELYLVKKAPALPDNVKEMIVKFAPWLTILMMLFAIPAILLVVGLGALVSPFTAFMGPAYAASFGFNYLIGTLILGVSVVLELMAIPGLFARSKKGWMLVYYSTLVSLLSSVVSFNVVSGLIGALIGFYFLFQIKSYYK